ncbi:MAG: glycosyltransferase family A protein [Pseudomonadota bacterium]|nr:glycosyltransferase family A protein [Pseudomonadota bacterium]
MKHDPRISVIIPTYNSGPYIAESIASVLAQTHQPTEILIVDDGSTDDTRAVVTAVDDPRIRYVAIPHRGTAAARNRGLELATGDYLAFLDADDRWRPTMLERQVAVLEGEESLVCSFTNFVRFVERTGETLPEQFDYYPELVRVPLAPAARGDALLVEGDAFVHFIAFGGNPGLHAVHHVPPDSDRRDAAQRVPHPMSGPRIRRPRVPARQSRFYPGGSHGGPSP